jgi:dipeptidyl aminopeptidase/acylaminoacyl peptidase
MSNPAMLPFGLWPSPVTADLVAQRVRLDEICWAADGRTLVWSEGRSGSSVLVAQTGCEAPREISAGCSPRGGVGYGGGTFATGISPGGESFVIFADRDGKLYRVGAEYDSPRPITPAFGSVASPAVSPDGQWVVFVFSDGKTDLIGLVDSQGRHWPIQLARGADYYMQPAWHPSGEWLAWVEWNQPNMPWDGTRIELAHLAPAAPNCLPVIEDVQTVAGGNIMAASQPVFSPDGRWLAFIEEGGETTDDEWPDLILYDLSTGQRRQLLQCDRCELSLPAWVQGVRSLGWSPNSRAMYYLRYQGPLTSLWVVDVDSGETRHIETGPYTWLSQLSVASQPDSLALVASAPNLPDRVIVLHSGEIRVAARSGAESLPPATFSVPREISWLAPDGSPVYGLYYPPHHPHYSAEGLPPAILNIHGGPTSIASTRFNSEAAYFTSRGYAWVDVNYRGSTGYGRCYRDALRGRWGEVDREDAAGCAQALAEQGLADPRRMVIRGSSAGGYTVLNTLIHYPGLFRAGICLYGVSNLFMLDLNTHKFEAHYNASLIGPLPAAAAQYHAFSPIFHAGQIRDPLIIFHGDQDQVVPPSQSEDIVAILRQNKVPHQFKRYPGEGHGFRKSETITDYLKETERFLQMNVLFA